MCPASANSPANSPAFSLERTRFDEEYHPSDDTRITTNFANLARGDSRRENLRRTLRMIEGRFNELAHWDNENGDRYAIELDIVSVGIDVDRTGASDTFPLIEILQTTIVDRRSGRRLPGIVGNNFSSYVRDYDFSVVLPAHRASGSPEATPDGFGELHGNLFHSFVHSDTYTQNFATPPVVCVSVSSSQTYRRTGNEHPVLGIEYRQDRFSLTDEYFAKMGLGVRFFMPPRSVAPLAFYFTGDLLVDYTNLELISTVSTMETFQKIYRPEIYNAHTPAGAVYRPDLHGTDYSSTRIDYDREERSRLAVEQGAFAEQVFVTPYRALLEAWSTRVGSERRERGELS